MDWFEQLFGFREAGWHETRDGFALDGEWLWSRANGRAFRVGRFATPTLGELRARTLEPRGPLRIAHEVIGDALALHATPDNEGATFQVASQFNCLEFVDETVVPEDGVSGYAHDPTQGPACSLAAAAATVYRNYFAPVNGESGQTRDRQIDNLRGLLEVLGPDGAGALVTVQNGYTFATSESLASLVGRLAVHDREALLARLAIGFQSGVEVTFASRFEPPSQRTFVSQAFCSAISCSYSGLPTAAWQPLATLVLDGAYEATLRAAAIDRDEGRGTGKVWLTFLGGGVFGNESRWIAGAIAHALRRCADLALDVRIAHFRVLDRALADALDASLGGGDPSKDRGSIQ